MEKPDISFLAMNLVLLFVAVGFTLVVFDLHRFAFVFELMLLLIFFLIFAFAMLAVHSNKKFGWTMLAAALALLMLNLLFIFLLTGVFETAHLTTLFFSLAGMAVALLSLRAFRSYDGSEEHEKVKDYYPYIDKMEPGPKAEEPISKTFIPGKYIASKKSNKYHAAKCDWAKKISAENQLWFNSEGDAKAQGFEADECIAS